VGTLLGALATRREWNRGFQLPNLSWHRVGEPPPRTPLRCEWTLSWLWCDRLLRHVRGISKGNRGRGILAKVVTAHPLRESQSVVFQMSRRVASRHIGRSIPRPRGRLAPGGRAAPPGQFAGIAGLGRGILVVGPEIRAAAGDALRAPWKFSWVAEPARLSMSPRRMVLPRAVTISRLQVEPPASR
jgi:hypothetical protein